MRKIKIDEVISPVTNIVTDSPLDQTQSTVVCNKSEKDWKDLEPPIDDKPGVWDNFLGFFNLAGHKESEEHREKRLIAEKDDKNNLLEKTVCEAGLLDALKNRTLKLNKNPANLKIVIKPNFMFLYNKDDHSTYTDPELVIKLVDILYNEGYRDITVVEAQSTYGNYFTNREVLTVMDYIGLKSDGKFKMKDLTDESDWSEPEIPFTGPLKTTEKLGSTPVPKVWKDADFRISFAKNKTHLYCYYTLTIKCIYGALAKQNKFYEYHCNRGIYGSTIEYIEHYPIHFGIIDAYISADGPLGIFANKVPNYTRTILAGENIIAVDWIGALKMKYSNPMINKYMKEAIDKFGKPSIIIKGNAKDSVYVPWIKASQPSMFIMNNIVDKCYPIGNVYTGSMLSVDENIFKLKVKWYVKILRFFTAIMRGFVFIPTKKQK
ncbi:MAG TPA: DUF362 domain-containing protein [Spirochaetota bacterium]|nr:DUF362 domain-containing protein [Spirochaetota bacterium]